MNCKEVQELFGTAIDGALHAEVEGPFHQHLAGCTHCRTAFELESMAKQMVRARVKRMPTPPHLYEKIVESLREKQNAEIRMFTPEWWDRVLSARIVVPTFTTAAAMLVLYLIFAPGGFDTSTGHTAANDIINQSLTNFELVRSGELKPTMVSLYADGVVGYFERNGMRFAVNVKSMENCDWYGAMSSNYNGVKQAHIMYKFGDDLVYVYQVNENQLEPGSTLQLPPAARKSLAETKWYTDPNHPDCNIVVWKTNGAVCTAVSTMKKDKLLALMTN